MMLITRTCRQPFEVVAGHAESDPAGLIRAALQPTIEEASGIAVTQPRRLAGVSTPSTVRFRVGEFSGDRASARVPVAWTCEGLLAAPGFDGGLVIFAMSAIHCELRLSGRVVAAVGLPLKFVAATLGSGHANDVAQRLLEGLVDHLDQLETQPAATR